jgi:hypothetical protein
VCWSAIQTQVGHSRLGEVKQTDAAAATSKNGRCSTYAIYGIWVKRTNTRRRAFPIGTNKTTRAKKEQTKMEMRERRKHTACYGYYPIEKGSQMKFSLESISPRKRTTGDDARMAA